MLNALSLLACIAVRNAHQFRGQLAACGESVGAISKLQSVDGTPEVVQIVLGVS